jgi:hypothetical protein
LASKARLSDHDYQSTLTVTVAGVVLDCVTPFASCPVIVISYVPAGVPVPLPPPPPPLPLPPHAGMTMMRTSTIQSKRKASHFFLREAGETKPAPNKTRPGIGNSSAKKAREGWRSAADEATVVKVRVAVPPLLPTVTGLVLPNEHVGAGVTAGEMLHESVTVPVYP